MDITFSQTPQLFGLVHFIILGCILAGLILLFFLLRKAGDRRLERLVFILGCCMIAAEIFKQWFVCRYLYSGVRSMWFFPWQLCSMAMYCSFALPFTKGKARDAVLVFLCTFSVIGAVVALVVPADMMRPQIVLFCHSFLYHAAMLLLVRKTRVRFWPSAVLFFGMASVAEIINLISHFLIPDISLQANMFYITPFYPTTQPVFDQIARHCGIFVEIILYLGLILAASYGLYRL